MHSYLERIILCQNETKQNKNPTLCGNYLALMEHCRENAFNLVPFQLISLTAHVLYDRTNPLSAGEQRTCYPFLVLKALKLQGFITWLENWKIKKQPLYWQTWQNLLLSPAYTEKEYEGEMQHCRSQCNPDPEWPQTNRASQQDNGARS